MPSCRAVGSNADKCFRKTIIAFWFYKSPHASRAERLISSDSVFYLPHKTVDGCTSRFLDEITKELKITDPRFCLIDSTLCYRPLNVHSKRYCLGHLRIESRKPLTSYFVQIQQFRTSSRIFNRGCSGQE